VSLDSSGCDWSQIIRDWSQLTKAERETAQREIDHLGRLSEPFHKVVRKIVNKIKGP
jgi:hypothetical protein